MKVSASMVEHNIVEEKALFEIAPGLKRLQERLWTTENMGSVSYPTAAHARIASLETSSFWFRHRNRVIGTLINKYPPEGPLLDVGGGNGSVSLALRRYGLSTIVLEPGMDASSIAHARGLTVIRATFNAEMFVEGSVSAIGIFDVIEHIDDDLQFLRDVRKVMSRGGLLYVTVPALMSLWSSDDQFAGHYRRYSRHSLRQTLLSAGFEIVALSGFFSLLVPLVFLFRTLPSAFGSRKVEDVDKALDHHRSEQGTGALMERILSFELPIIARGHAFPFGTSLVAVARKSTN